MKKINYRRLFILVALTSLAVVYGVIWARMITDNAQRTGTDFIAFYAGGRVSQQHGFDKAYDIQLQKQVQEEQVGFELADQQVLLYNHLPFLLPVLWLWMSDNYVLSFFSWTFWSLGCYVLALTLAVKLLPSALPDPISKMAYWGGGLLFFPVFISLLQGQDTAILFLGVSLWLVGLVSGQHWLAGLGLGLTSIRPHVALLLAIPFAFRQQKVFIWALGFGGLLALFSIWLIGLDGTQQFINILLISASGEWFGMNEKDMYNLIGIFFRLFPQADHGVMRAAAWGVYILTIGGLSIAWKNSPGIDNRLTGIALILAVLVAPHLHYHDLAVLWFPLLFVAQALARRRGMEPASALSLLPAISMALLFSFLIAPLQFVVPYLVMALCAIALFKFGAGYPGALKTGG